jgi:transcriptional antiterminator RfaH
MSELLWFVAHTRPRCEKKLVEHCLREKLRPTLPTYKVAHHYRGKDVSFDKPLFPGYVFLQIAEDSRSKVYNSDYVANLLDVPDQMQFADQLESILRALESGIEIKLTPDIGKGSRVKIKSGPLQGIEGWVEERYGTNTVLLRLDFIGQAAAIQQDVANLELI